MTTAMLRCVGLLLVACALVGAESTPAEADDSVAAPAPAGITVDLDGSVYVSDYSFDRIIHFAPDGTLLSEWGGSGAGVGQFNAPFGVALDERGALYVADQLNDRVQKFATDGTPLAVWGGPGSAAGLLRTPFDVAVAGGRVYVADFGNDRVQIFAPDGTPLGSIGSRGSGDGQFQRPAGVAVDRDGDVLVTDHFNNRVERFSASDGHYEGQFGGAPSPLAAAPPASATATLSGTASAATASPTLAPTPTPTLSVASTSSSAVGAPAATSTPGAGPLDLSLRRPEGIALDQNENVWVADYGHDRVVKFSLDGRVLLVIGGSGSAPGQFVGPKGLAIDPTTGHLYVADTGNARIQRFAPDGTFDTAWPLPTS